MWHALFNEEWALDLIDDNMDGIIQSIEAGTEFGDEQDEVQLDANASLCVLPNNRYDRLKALQKGSMDHYGKLQRQVSDVRKLIGLGWHEDTIIVFLKLDRRGFEPLFPRSWMPDFPLFPSFLFCPDEWAGGPLIKNLHGSEFRAIRAFDTFCMVGQSVRDAIISHTSPTRRPEAVISRAIRKYVKWAWSDVNYLAYDLQHGRVPKLLTIVTAKPGQAAEELDDIINDKLRRLSDELRNTLRHDPGINPYPTLFGMVIYGNVVAVVAYEPMNHERDTIRTIGFYHFEIQLEECWNCISLAILIHYIRHQLVRLQQALERCPPLTMREYTPVQDQTSGNFGSYPSPENMLGQEQNITLMDEEIPHPPYSPLTPAIKEEYEYDSDLEQELADEDEEYAYFANLPKKCPNKVIKEEPED
jgi:hypothetical protein